MIDLESPRDQLLDALTGVDTVISAISFTQIGLQYPLAEVAKEAGVKRFVPCDFGTPCVGEEFGSFMMRSVQPTILLP